MAVKQEDASISELQAGCYAGVWAHKSGDKWKYLTPTDIAAALEAARSVGDDYLMRQAGEAVVPDQFTHGTSAQRAKWLSAGIKGGTIASCDTSAE